MGGHPRIINSATIDSNLTEIRCTVNIRQKHICRKCYQRLWSIILPRCGRIAGVCWPVLRIRHRWARHLTESWRPLRVSRLATSDCSDCNHRHSIAACRPNKEKPAKLTHTISINSSEIWTAEGKKNVLEKVDNFKS